MTVEMAPLQTVGPAFAPDASPAPPVDPLSGTDPTAPTATVAAPNVAPNVAPLAPAGPAPATAPAPDADAVSAATAGGTRRDLRLARHRRRVLLVLSATVIALCLAGTIALVLVARQRGAPTRTVVPATVAAVAHAGGATR